MITWLEKRSLFPKFFWKERSSAMAWAACGKKQEHFSLPENVKNRVFGAKAFLPFPTDDPLWNAFPPCYFFEPQEIKQGPLPLSETPLSLSPKTQIYMPNQARWEENVRLTQENIKKAVLARVTTFFFEEALNPWDILRRLLFTTTHATVFAFQPSPSALFLGASPEKLYSRSSRTLLTESIAGTRPLSAPDEELLTSSKDRLEFDIVKESISSTLSPLSTAMHWRAEDTLIKTTAVKHLYNQLRVTLKERVSDTQLIAALHPSPATGGEPKEAALKWISEIESFQRGLYAAPIGWMDADGTEFAVGIRSALIVENKLHLFTGAGIVKDSDPTQEWEEIETKMRPFTHLFSHEFCNSHHR